MEIVLTPAEEVEESKVSTNNQITVGHFCTEGMEALYRTACVNTIDKLIDLSDSIEERTIILTDIEEMAAVGVNTYIRFWNKCDRENNIPVEQRKPIIILLDSNGGSLDAGLSIHDSIVLSTTPVYTVNISKAYSAGMLIYLAGHQRFTFPNASFLWHEGSCGLNQTDANKFDNYAEFYKLQRQSLKKIMLAQTNICEDDYNEHSRDDWWFSADEAIEKGIATNYVEKII